MPSRPSRVVLGLLVTLLAAPASAEAAFSVGPSVRDLALSPGDARVDSFRVKTQGERGHFVVEIEDVLQRPDGGLSYQRPRGSRFSASSWLQVFPRSFVGRPNRVQPVEYRVRVPADAEPGDHVASLTVKRLPPPGAREVTTIQAVSVRLTVRVAGRRREGVAIERLDTPSLAGRGPITAHARLRNTGNVRLDFDRANRGSLAFLTGDDERARVRLRGLLFPGQVRDFELETDDPPLAGPLTARAVVKTRRDSVSREADVWMVPWRQAGALVLVALAALAVSGGRRRRRSAAVAVHG
jgi:hypothetical protein